MTKRQIITLAAGVLALAALAGQRKAEEPEGSGAARMHLTISYESGRFGLSLALASVDFRLRIGR